MDVTISRLAMDKALHRAFENDEFVLHYQPQISLSSGRVVGLEALVRWQNPDHGLILPNRFLPDVERIGRMPELSEFVINSACRQMRLWQSVRRAPMRVAVNLSAPCLGDPGVVDTICRALRENSLKPAQLEVEITESDIQYKTESRRVLSELAEIGIQLAIDDFGTGYSSLASLKHLPVHRLKIDRLFIRDMLDDTRDAILLGAIVGLAHALNYSVVAEGVEDIAQLRVLSGIDCDTVQGFYFCRPVDACSVPALMQKNFLSGSIEIEDVFEHEKRSSK